MTRRGRCRCGKVLVFAWTSQGYKTRCASCLAVVRLRLDEPVPAPLPRLPPARKTDYLTTPLHDGPDATRPLDLSDLSEHESSAPVALAELEVYAEPPRPARRLIWWIVAGLAVFLAGLGITLALLGQRGSGTGGPVPGRTGLEPIPTGVRPSHRAGTADSARFAAAR